MYLTSKFCRTAPGNGGKTDKYVWTQTLSELTVTIPVPDGTKAKMLSIDFSNTKLKVIVTKLNL